MVSTWRSKSNALALETLNEKLEDLKNVSYNFSEIVNQRSDGFGVKGKGAPTGAFGATSGNQIFNPTVQVISEFDEVGVATGIFDRLNVGSRFMIVKTADPTDVNIKWIQLSTANGQPITIQIEKGKTGHLQVGGNIDITSQIDFADNEIPELIFSEESDITPEGGYVVVGLSSGGGGGISLPLNFTITFLGTIGSLTQNIDFSLSTRHGWQAEFNGDIALAFNNPPTGELGYALFKFKQDAIGGHTLTLPVGTINKDIVEAGFLLAPNEETGIVIEFFNNTFYAFLETGNLVSGGIDVSDWSTLPAVSDIDYATFDGINIDRLLFSQTVGSFLSSGQTGITSDGAGNMNFNVPINQQYNFKVNDSPFNSLTITDDLIISQTIIPAAIDDLGINIIPWNHGYINNITVGGAGSAIDAIGHLDFVDNLATPAAPLAIYSDGDDLFANTGGGVVNLSDIGAGAGSNEISQGDSSVLVSDVGSGAINFTVDNMAQGSITTTFGWVFENDVQIPTGDLILGGGGSDIGNIGTLTFADNLASPIGVKMYSDGTDIFANTSLGVKNLKDIGAGLTGANVNLSNLGLTEINQSLVPEGSFNLGAITKRWSTVFTEFLDVIDTAIFDGDVILGDTDSDTISMNGKINTDIEFSAGFTIDFNAGQSAVGSAGFADALPNSPDTYIIVRLNGNELLIPAFDKP